ncbi:unnamed protein product [Schistocephalus solidus]|uniref:Uncharacterized protein n=1 Tax=Schistocephalus solidus TaxID=70667 RepID=A0A183ST12_SCHSO|nr:unnamed protein product [Schistocephalus solidus]
MEVSSDCMLFDLITSITLTPATQASIITMITPSSNPSTLITEETTDYMTPDTFSINTTTVPLPAMGTQSSLQLHIHLTHRPATALSPPPPPPEPGVMTESRRPEAGEDAGGWRGRIRPWAHQHTWLGSHEVGVP